jgi:hypothetical protein
MANLDARRLSVRDDATYLTRDCGYYLAHHRFVLRIEKQCRGELSLEQAA